MAKDYAKAFYNSDAWKNTRNAYYTHARGICARCQKEFEEGKRSLEDMQPEELFTTRNILHRPTLTIQR